MESPRIGVVRESMLHRPLLIKVSLLGKNFVLLTSRKVNFLQNAMGNPKTNKQTKNTLLVKIVGV